jgi:predicted metal-dependent phosphotriesterase family hydrolase
LLETFVPMLRERGVSDEQIHQMLVENPARVLARPARETP